MSENVPDISDEKLYAILSMVKKAKSDNERFAALLVVSKFTKGGSLSLKKRRELLKTIGIPFPLRLLMTACSEIKQESNKHAFAAIGVSILWSFCADAEFFKENGIVAAIPYLLNVVKIFSEEDNSVQIVNDCFECLQALSNCDDCVTKIVENDAITVLCECAKQNRNMAIKFVSILITKQPNLWNDSNLQKMVQLLASEFKTDQTTEKFTLCDQLFQLLSTIPDGLCVCADLCMTDIMHGLQDILCSKLTEGQRKPALQLSSEVFRLHGISWFTTHSKEDNFIVVVTRLACIEIGLFLRSVSDGIAEKCFPELLTACYFISETFCSAITQFEQNESEVGDVLNFEQIRLTQPALADMANSISNYISDMISEKPAEDLKDESSQVLLPSSIRLLGSWLNIENNVTSAQGIETLPLVKRILQHIIKTNDVNLIKTVLPPIMLAADAMETRKTIIESGILSALNSAVAFMEIKVNASPTKDELLTVHLILQTLISVCAPMTQVECKDRHDDLQKIYSALSRMTEKSFSVLTYGYLHPLLTVLLNKSLELHGNSNDLLIISNILDFLFNAHEISPTNGQLGVSSGYQQSWPEISSMWKICAEEITECAQKNVKIKKQFLESRHSKSLSDLVDAARLGKDIELTEIFFNLSEIFKRES